MGIFVENTGYRIPTPNELTKILFREETRKNSMYMYFIVYMQHLILNSNRNYTSGSRNGSGCNH